jgi:uncharacterized membrane protein YadS
MDNDLAFGITYATAIGSGLMAGLFSMFSLFVMRALDALPTPQGIAAMQSINRKILNPIFLLTFAGVGLRTNIGELRQQGLRPFVVGALAETSVAFATLLMVLAADRLIGF